MGLENASHNPITRSPSQIGAVTSDRQWTGQLSDDMFWILLTSRLVLRVHIKIYKI